VAGGALRHGAPSGDQVSAPRRPDARRERFAREIKTLAMLRHPFIARLYDAGALAEGTPWFVMEYVEGVPFLEYCCAPERTVEERLRLFRALCEAVQYAHGQEIIHRDLKPSNILVERDGTPRLLDFGISRELHNLDAPDDRTVPALRFVSPDYAAPEWTREGRFGFYTDVYSLGVILYEMLTERLPFDRSQQQDARVTAEPENPSVAGRRLSREAGASGARWALSKAAWNDLDVLCLKAMQKDPAARYPSVEALKRDIDHYLSGQPLDAGPDRFQYRLGKFVKRNRRSVLAASAAFCLVIGLVTVFTLQLARERDRANREAAITAATNRFLSEDLLGKTDPFRSPAAQESFVDVVAGASPQIDSKFAGQPLLAARLHQTIAGAFDNRSDFPRARDEYGRAFVLFKQAEGPLSQDAILVSLRQAAMEARAQQPDSLAHAKSLFGDAQTTIARIPHPRSDLAAWSLIARANIEVVDLDAVSASKDYSAALHLARTTPSVFDEDKQRRIKELLAFCYIRSGDPAKAEPVLREVAEEYSRIGGTSSADALRARLRLSQTLLTQHKYGEALREANLVYPGLVQRLGEDHEATIVQLGTRAEIEARLHMWDAAVRDDLAMHDRAARKLGENSMFAIDGLSDAGLVQCMAGQYRQGESKTRKAFLEAEQAFGPRGGLTGGTSYGLAYCLIGLDRLQEASELLHNIDVPAAAQLSGDPTVGAQVAVAEGEIASREGDYESAERYAKLAASAFDRPDADPSDRQSLQKLRASIQAHLREPR